MAAKKKKNTTPQRDPAVGTSRPLRWEDLTKSEQRSAGKGIKELGMVKKNMPKSLETLQGIKDNPNVKKSTQLKAGRQLNSMLQIAENKEIKNRPMTLESATQSRINRIQSAIADAHTRSAVTGNKEPMRGVAWYFEHHRAQRDATGGAWATPHDPTGGDMRAAIGGILSSGKTPEDERAGMSGISRLTSGDHTLTVHTNAASKEIGLPIGTHSIKSLPSEAIAKAAGLAASEHKGTRSTGVKSVTASDHDALIMAGRPHVDNTEKAIDLLRNPDVSSGKVSAISAGFNPATTPKTWSYATATANAVPDTQAEIDYRNIAHHLVHGDPNQGMFMFSQGSEDSPLAPILSEDSPLAPILSPDADTAEDTWQQAISTGQPPSIRGASGPSIAVGKRLVDTGGPASPGMLTKAGLGLPREKQVTIEGTVHAFNNQATRNAAKAMGPISFNQFGQAIHMPSVMAQEVGWTQQRIEANADPEYNAEMNAWTKAVKENEKKKPVDKLPEQPTLPGF